MRKLITHATAAYGATAGPNSSTAIMLAEIGAFAAPASRLTIPIAEKTALSNPNIWLKTLPDVAPTKNIGVTIPPLPPKLRVIDVNRIFKRKAPGNTVPPFENAFDRIEPKTQITG